MFYRKYELLKDLPTLPKESLLKWNCWREHFSDVGDWIGLNPPKEKVIFTLDEIEAKPDWFKGVGTKSEYYPKFPTQKEFFDESDGHCYLGETHHNDMCRVCQLIGKIEVTKELKEAVYKAYKSAYEARF